MYVCIVAAAQYNVVAGSAVSEAADGAGMRQSIKPISGSRPTECSLWHRVPSHLQGCEHLSFVFSAVLFDT